MPDSMYFVILHFYIHIFQTAIRFATLWLTSLKIILQVTNRFKIYLQREQNLLPNVVIF